MLFNEIIIGLLLKVLDIIIIIRHRCNIMSDLRQHKDDLRHSKHEEHTLNKKKQNVSFVSSCSKNETTTINVDDGTSTLNKKKRNVSFVSSCSKDEKTIFNVDDQTSTTIRKKNKFKDSVKSSGLFGFFRKKETCSFVNIPSWKTNETYVNDKKCVMACNYSCQTCLNAMFSSKIRGKPIADLQWFNDKLADHICSPRYRNYPSIQKKLYSMLRQHEIELRQISRKDVFESLLSRFRGFYNPQNGDDYVDIIINTYKFPSIRHWCLWKSDIDYKFLMEWHSIRNKVLYCSGCGDKCTRFQASNSNIFYQKCSNNACDFFCKEGSTYATIVKKR